MKPIIATSILSADFGYLAKDIEMVNRSEAEWVHIDIMDGVFVPNISFGFPVLKYVAKLSQKPLDVHLMIVNPEKFIPEVKGTQSSPRRYSGDGAHLRADTCYKLSFKEGHVPLFDLVCRGTRSAYPDRSRFLRLPSRQKESGEHKARRCGALVDSPGGRYYLASRGYAWEIL